MNQDYDSYVLNPLDTTRIQPLLEQIRLKDLSFKFFISSVYWTPTKYDVVQRHNRNIRKTLRTFFKEDLRMWFFIEKHLDPSQPSYGGFSRHILLEDVPSSRWKHPSNRMRNFLMDDPEAYFASTVGDGLNIQQKMDLLKRVIHLLPFIPNGKSGLDIRPIHNLEKLTAYCSKQFELVLPAYEVIDPVSSDIDISYLLNYKQNGTQWKSRYNPIPPRPYRSLSATVAKPILAG